MRRQSARLKFKARHEALWKNIFSPMVEVPPDVWENFEYSCDQVSDENQKNCQGNDLRHDVQYSSINGSCMRAFIFSLFSERRKF